MEALLTRIYIYTHTYTYQDFWGAHFLLDVLNALKFSVFHGEGPTAARNIVQEVLQDHLPVDGEADLRVELCSIQLLRFICDAFECDKKQETGNTQESQAYAFGAIYSATFWHKSPGFWLRLRLRVLLHIQNTQSLRNQGKHSDILRKPLWK